MDRVRLYECTCYNYETRKTTVHVHPFIGSQARQAGVQLHRDGIARTAALRLIKQWNELGDEHVSIKYVYTIREERDHGHA